jgi:hypothetical protein
MYVEMHGDKVQELRSAGDEQAGPRRCCGYLPEHGQESRASGAGQVVDGEGGSGRPGG